MCQLNFSSISVSGALGAMKYCPQPLAHSLPLGYARAVVLERAGKAIDHQTVRTVAAAGAGVETGGRRSAVGHFVVWS